MSGRPESNWQHSPWKGDTLPIELRPLLCGRRRIRTFEVLRQQIYSLPQLTALVPSRSFNMSNKYKIPPTIADDYICEPTAGFEPTTGCLQNSCSTPELRWLVEVVKDGIYCCFLISCRKTRKLSTVFILVNKENLVNIIPFIVCPFIPNHALLPVVIHSNSNYDKNSYDS